MGVLIVVCFVVRYSMTVSSFAIILMGKRELVSLLGFAAQRVGLRFVIMVFPYHTHLVFFIRNCQRGK